MFKISRKIIYMHFCLCKFCWAVYLVTGGHYSIRRLIILPVIFPPPCPALNSSIFFPVFFCPVEKQAKLTCQMFDGATENPGNFETQKNARTLRR